jgi:SAM-dependent methyltransferase
MDRLTTAQDRLWSYEPYVRDQWVQDLARALPSGTRVLDAGAGASKYRPFFQHCRYETQDFCQYEGALVQYLQPIDHVCEITKLPVADATFDVILCTEVIEHVVDPMAVLREFARVLKPGGQLWITAPLLSYLHMEPYHYYGGFTHHWYRHWLPATGFAVRSITPVGGPGRSCVVYAQGFYNAWAEREKSLGPLRRLASHAFRALWKIPVHLVLPRLLLRFDRWLGTDRICSGYLVVGVRQPPAPAAS